MLWSGSPWHYCACPPQSSQLWELLCFDPPGSELSLPGEWQESRTMAAWECQAEPGAPGPPGKGGALDLLKEGVREGGRKAAPQQGVPEE